MFDFELFLRVCCCLLTGVCISTAGRISSWQPRDNTEQNQCHQWWHLAASTACCHNKNSVLTLESSYCFQRVLAIAILSVCLSVRPSVTWVDQAKTVQARITKSLSSAAWKTLVSGTAKLFHKFEGGHPERGCKGGGQNLRFLANKSLYLIDGAR